MRTRVFPEPAGAMTLRAAGRMADGRQLVRGEVGPRRVVGDGREGSRLGVPAVHDADAAGERRGSERPPVDVQRCAVTQHDVGRARLP